MGWHEKTVRRRALVFCSCSARVRRGQGGGRTPRRDSRALPILDAEPIALPPAGQDQRLAESLVDLVAQVTDVDIDHVGGVAALVAVEVRADRRAAHHLAPVRGKELE